MLSLKALISKILTSLSGLITIASYTQSGLSYSTWYGTTSFNVSKAGYTPIALVSVSLNQAALHCYYWGVTASSNTAIVGVGRHTSGSAIASLTITINVLYIRSDFVTA